MRLYFNFLFLFACLSLNASFPWSNILLIINYNFAHYESIPLLKKIYSSYFEHIVFYGPDVHDEVRHIKEEKGYLSYAAIADAVEQYPQFDGYLFVMDDCIIHPWRFENFDKNKIWFTNFYFCNPSNGQPILLERSCSWYWWNTKWGAHGIKKAYPSLYSLAGEMLQKNWGLNGVIGGYSDIAYIPAQYAYLYCELAHICLEHEIFLELALPTILSCLAPKNTWHYMHGHGVERRTPCTDYKRDVDFNHPMKLSNPTIAAFINEFFALKRCMR